MRMKNIEAVSQTVKPRTRMSRYASGIGALLLLTVLSACGLNLDTGTSGGSSNTPSDDGGATLSKFQEGDCIGYSSINKRNFKTTCGSSDSTDKVVKVIGRKLSDAELDDPNMCPGDSSLELTSNTYCLVLDVKPGDCLTPSSETEGSYKLDCATPGKKERVTKVIADPNGDCDQDVSAHTSENPPQTVCVAEVD